MASSNPERSPILEQGDIFFFYRPKVGLENVGKLEDVAAFNVVLHPLNANRFRFAAVALKGLLQAEDGNAGWWVKVEKIEDSPDAVTKRLGEAHPIPAARACGEGLYAISKHKGHTHLAYALELPAEPGEVQKALGIASRGNPVLGVVNPLLEALAGPGSPQVVLPAYPPDLLALFGDRRLIPADPAKLLDYEGAELLIQESEHLDVKAMGIDLIPAQEAWKTAEVYELLKVHRQNIPLEPLFEGRWV